MQLVVSCRGVAELLMPRGALSHVVVLLYGAASLPTTAVVVGVFSGSLDAAVMSPAVRSGVCVTKA